MATKIGKAIVRGSLVSCTTLAIVFSVLKLGGVITWSWFIVLLPLWGWVFAVIFVVTVLLIILGLADLIANRENEDA